MSRRSSPEPTLEIAGGTHDRVWNEVVDVVSEEFEVDEEARGERIGDNLLTRRRFDAEPVPVSQPLALDAPPAGSLDGPRESYTTVRRRAFIHMSPSDEPGRWKLSVNVLKEFEANGFPAPLAIQPTHFDGENGPVELGPVDVADESGWGSSVRDCETEDKLLAEVQARFDQQNMHGVPQPSFTQRLLSRVIQDHKNLYSRQNLLPFALILGTDAILANSALDTEMMEMYQDKVRNTSLDNISTDIKPFGDGAYTVPAFLAFTAATKLMQQRYAWATTPADWGERTLRGYLIGGIPVLVLQEAIGAGRPDQYHGASNWHPLNSNHSVSGHAFMGGVPWMTAAQMTNDWRLKSLFYSISVLPGLTRFNDHDHYASQIILGWGLAYLASSAVSDTESAFRKNCTIVPMPMSSGFGIGLEYRH